MLSTEENDSLALKEALIAGLPAIVSEGVVKNIQMTSDIYKYIRVVPESDINETKLSFIILEHITNCRKHKDVIRHLATESFSLQSILKSYIHKLQEYIGKE